MDGDGSRAVYVCIAVDVSGVVASADGNGGAVEAPVDATAARPIAANSDQVIATTPTQLEDRGTSALSVVARAGDQLRVYAVSGSNNFEGAVLLAGVAAARSGPDEQDPVLGRFALAAFEQEAITPAEEPPAIAAADAEQQFWFWQAAILGSGTQACHALLALYGRDEHGQPRFAGLYRWDFSLTVNLTEPPENTNQGGVR